MSINEPERHYIGFTTDLKQRLAKHNSGQVPHTSKHTPWKIKFLYLLTILDLFLNYFNKLICKRIEPLYIQSRIK